MFLIVFNLLKLGKNESQKNVLANLLKENKEELEKNLNEIIAKFKQDNKKLIEKFENKCFESKYLELIVEKWKFEFISCFNEIL